MNDSIPLPPGEMNYVGNGDFALIGQQVVSHLCTAGGLKPDDSVLDVGCGVGRVAIPLTKYLSPRGRYEGFDIVGVGIEWCRQEITSRFPNFKFQVADVYNPSYHPEGKFDASDYVFPYRDESFDFVFLTSVFTHMLPVDVENYLSQIARVLKTNGRLYATFFLDNPETQALIDQGKSVFQFATRGDGYRANNANAHEDAIQYDEGYVLSSLEKYGFELAGPVHYGRWTGRTGMENGQDVVVATRSERAVLPMPRRNTSPSVHRTAHNAYSDTMRCVDMAKKIVTNRNVS